MNDKNSRGKGFESKNKIWISLLACTLIAGFSLTACTPSTNTTNTTVNKTYSHETILSPNLKARQAANPHDSKFEISHEARDKALEAKKDEKKVVEKPFYLELGNRQIKVVPGFYPGAEGDLLYFDKGENTLYYYDKVGKPSSLLLQLHFKAAITAFTSYWWQDVIAVEKPDYNYVNITNKSWQEEIESECQFGKQAFLSLVGWPGYENLKWEDYCHKNVPMIPPFPRESRYN